MKRIISILFIFVFIQLSKASENNSLQLECTYSFILGSEVEGKILLDAHIYIRNGGDKVIDIPIGDLARVRAEQKLITINLYVETTQSGELIMPSPLQVDIVKLGPKKLLKLRSIRFPIEFRKTKEIPIVFKVSEKLETFYSVWTGELEGRIVFSPAP